MASAVNLFRTMHVQFSGGNIQSANIHGPFDDVIRSPFQLSKSKVCLRLTVYVRRDTLDETLPMKKLIDRILRV